jgi:hypothetical protein
LGCTTCTTIFPLLLVEIETVVGSGGLALSIYPEVVVLMTTVCVSPALEFVLRSKLTILLENYR